MSNNPEVNLDVVVGTSKLYVKPSIIHELKMETRAGSPLSPISGGLADPFDAVDSVPK